MHRARGRSTGRKWRSCGRLAFGRQVAGAADLAVAPGVGGLQFADGAVADQFPHAVEVLDLVALRADLRGEFVFVLQVVGADDAGFLDAVAQRLLAIDMHVAVQRPVGDEGVRVIGRADTTALMSFWSRHLRQSTYVLALGNFFGRVGQVLLVHVAEGHDVFAGQRRRSAPARPHVPIMAMLSLLLGAFLPARTPLGRIMQAGAGGGGGIQEMATIHGWFSLVRRRLEHSEDDGGHHTDSGGRFTYGWRADSNSACRGLQRVVRFGNGNTLLRHRGRHRHDWR